MTAAQIPNKSGQLKLIASAIVFIVFLVVLLMTAGLGNATHKPEARIPVVVATGTIKIEEGFESPVSVFGLIESPKTTSVSFDMSGQVNVLLVDEGDNVSVGDVLAKQDTKRLIARGKELEASLARAKADLVLADVNNKRVISLVQKKLESAQRLDEAKAALNVAKAQVSEIEASRNSLDVEINKSTLLAPFDGIVNRRFIDEGSVVAAGSPVLGITSVEPFQARFAVPADVIEQFETNKAVQIKVGDTDVSATILKKLPVRNIQTRTIDILVSLDSHQRVRPGDMAVLTGFRSHHETGCWLPVSALSNGLRGLWRVFVLTGNQQSTLEARVVEVVYTNGHYAFVRGALKDGEVYVNEGTHKLAPGQLVSLQSETQAGSR